MYVCLYVYSICIIQNKGLFYFKVQNCVLHLVSTTNVDLEDVYRFVTPVYASHWRRIGIQLGMEEDILENIDHEYHSKAEDCCNIMWEKWLNANCNACWDKVIEVIESAAVLSTSPSASLISSGLYNTVPVIIANVTDQLQKQFKLERYKMSEDDWPSYQPKHFTTVALIHHREKHTTETEVAAVADKMRKGKIVAHPQDYEEDSSSNKYLATCKATKDISDIFSAQISDDENTEYTKPNIILIEGAPGIGKTILSKEIAF